MKQVIVDHKKSNEIMEIVQKMRDAGLVQGKDFDFAYHPSKWDDMIGETPTRTVFTFYDDKLATWYTLKLL